MQDMQETEVRSLGLWRSPGEGNGNSLQYSLLENPMGRGAWRATVHGVAKSWTWLSVHTHTHTHTHPSLCKNLQSGEVSPAYGTLLCASWGQPRTDGSSPTSILFPILAFWPLNLSYGGLKKHPRGLLMDSLTTKCIGIPGLGMDAGEMERCWRL